MALLFLPGIRGQAAAHAAAAATVGAAQAGVDAALAAVAAAPQDRLPAVLAGAAHARAAFRRAAAAAAAPGIAVGRERWLHANEAPCPAITALLKPRGAPTTVAALRAANGSVVTTNEGIADRFVEHFASVSAAPAVVPAAQARVFAALHTALANGAVRRLDPEAAHAAGSPSVSCRDVVRAMAAAPAGSAPGPDGLPYELWTVRASAADADGELPDPVWAPLLARLFSAMAAVGALPAGFHLGTITALPKPDSLDAASPAAYRPITLLNADYRILARVLAKRYAVAMSPAIGHEQSAFLPGRRIETTILTTLLAHDALVLEGTSAVAALLDIAKAYDTVCRPFLFAAMEALGASPGMLDWTRLMLSATAASAHANGVESRARVWDAGVRQGCPLSPVLYLFVAQALTSWLQAQPALGIVVDGGRQVAAQFADDTTAFLRTEPAAALADDPPVAVGVPPSPLSPAERALLEALDTFASATNQHVSLPKSRAVLIGAWPGGSPRPAAVAGMPVVAAARLLGVPFAPVGPGPRSARAVGQPYATRAAARPPVTAAPPPHPFAAAMWTARLAVATSTLARVSRLPLSAMGHGLAASAYAISTALYALELGDTPPTAVSDLYAATLAAAPSHVPPRLLHGSPRVGGFGLLPVRSHVFARHAAMALRLLSHLLQPPAVPGAGTPPAPVPPHAQLAAAVLRRACPTLHPAQTLLAFTEVSADAAAAGVLAIPTVTQDFALPQGFLRRAAAALSALGPLATVIGSTAQTPQPPALQPASLRRSRLLEPGVSTTSLQTLISSLAWVRPADSPLDPSPPPLSPLALHPSVRAITATLEADTVAYRAARHLAFVRDALAAPALAPSSPLVAAFASALVTAWRLRLDNRVKEPFWRLASDAFPGARFRNWTCPCGTSGSTSPASRGRRHAFWDCPVAQAVREQLHSPDVPGGPAPTAVDRADVWLLRPPATYAGRSRQWSVVALAAVAAMEFGRAVLWARSVAGEQTVVVVAGRLAVARFWALLEEVPPPLR